MKKTISIFLLMCFSLSLMGMASAETGSNEATIKGQILAYTEDWFTDNFSEHYDISDYEASVNNFQQSGADIIPVLRTRRVREHACSSYA